RIEHAGSGRRHDDQRRQQEFGTHSALLNAKLRRYRNTDDIGRHPPDLGSLIEDPLANLIDDLARLPQREFDRVIEGRVPVGTDEAMFLALAIDLFLDQAGGLILPLALERRSANDEALVRDRLTQLFRRRRGRAETEQGFEKRHGTCLTRSDYTTAAARTRLARRSVILRRNRPRLSVLVNGDEGEGGVGDLLLMV